MADAEQLPDAPPPSDRGPLEAPAAAPSAPRDSSGRFTSAPPAPAAAAPEPAAPVRTDSGADIERAAYDDAAEQAFTQLLETTEPAAQDAPADPAGDAGPSEGAPAPVESGSEPSEDLQKARVSLLRSGFKAAEIDGMAQEEVLARGLERADVIASNADLVRRIRELELASPNGQAEPQEQVAETAPTLEEQLAPLIEAIEDEEAVKPLVDVITGLHSRLQAFEKNQANAVQQQEDALLLAARDRVGKQFADVLDDSRLPLLRSRMGLLSKDEAYREDPRPVMDKFVEVMTSAARSLGYSENLEPQPAPRESVDHLKSAGTPQGTTITETARGPVTEEDLMWAGFTALADGASPEQATAKVARRMM